MLGLIALLTFVLLARAFRSLLLPLKAVLLNVLSARRGLGRRRRSSGRTATARTLLWGIARDRLDPVLAAADRVRVPLRALDGLRGLHPRPHARGVRRNRLNQRRPSSTGIGRTGRLVTSAALILFLSFVALSTAPGDRQSKMLATGLGAGILIDATIIRALLVPALVSLFGRWNWWLPICRPGSCASKPHRPRSRADGCPPPTPQLPGRRNDDSADRRADGVRGRDARHCGDGAPLRIGGRRLPAIPSRTAPGSPRRSSPSSSPSAHSRSYRGDVASPSARSFSPLPASASASR